MSRPTLPADERLLDLLVQQATEGLDRAAFSELQRSLTSHPELDPHELELAAAAVDRAFAEARGPAEALPDDVRARVLAAAVLPAPAQAPPVDEFAAARARRTTSRPRSWFSPQIAGWYVAAALLIAVLFAMWPGERTAPPSLDVAQQRTRLMLGTPDVIRVAWNVPETPELEQVRGDVVWSTTRQAGFLRLEGLPVNDAAREQYQLWIVDPQRDEHPIDGGVFDVPAGADEVIVPIDAKLPVIAPAAFAITLERSGGVVVSDGPLLVVAPVAT